MIYVTSCSVQNSRLVDYIAYIGNYRELYHHPLWDSRLTNEYNWHDIWGFEHYSIVDMIQTSIEHLNRVNSTIQQLHLLMWFKCSSFTSGFLGISQVSGAVEHCSGVPALAFARGHLMGFAKIVTHSIWIARNKQEVYSSMLGWPSWELHLCFRFFSPTFRHLFLEGT